MARYASTSICWALFERRFNGSPSRFGDPWSATPTPINNLYHNHYRVYRGGRSDDRVLEFSSRPRLLNREGYPSRTCIFSAHSSRSQGPANDRELERREALNQARKHERGCLLVFIDGRRDENPMATGFIIGHYGDDTLAVDVKDVIKSIMHKLNIRRRDVRFATRDFLGTPDVLRLDGSM